MNAPLTRAAEGLDRWAFTVAEVERMVEAGVIPPDARIEVIGGEGMTRGTCRWQWTIASDPD
jgi:hypothetical protein